MAHATRTPVGELAQPLGIVVASGSPAGPQGPLAHMALAEALSKRAGTGNPVRAGYCDGVDARGVSDAGVELGINGVSRGKKWSSHVFKIRP